MSTTTQPPAQNPLVAPYKLVSLANTEIDKEATKYGGQGALAEDFVPKTGGGKKQNIHIAYDYRWTLSPIQERDKQGIPTIILKEYKQLEGSLKEQLNNFGGTISDKFFSSDYDNPTEVYEKIWQKTGNTATGFTYMFPYFNDVAYSMGTSPWQQLDGIGQQISDAASGALDALGSMGMKNIEKTGKALIKTAQLGNAAADVALKWRYPSVGVADRPKIFAGHTERVITIDFPLFNTIQKDDWKKNLDFIQLFASQNLYNKRDFVTGVPPVWYELEVPGQYFCWAACVTDFTVKNLGNIHSVGQTDWKFGLNVPDAYQITITLQELTQPSKNQFSRVIQVCKSYYDT